MTDEDEAQNEALDETSYEALNASSNEALRGIIIP